MCFFGADLLLYAALVICTAARGSSYDQRRIDIARAFCTPSPHLPPRFLPFFRSVFHFNSHSTGPSEAASPTKEHRFPRVAKLAGFVGGTVTGVVKGAATVAVSAKDVALDTAVGVASTAVGAVRTVATGNPVLMMREAQNKVVDVGAHLGSAINTAQGVFGKVSFLPWPLPLLLLLLIPFAGQHIRGHTL